ncbi:hypothetical protein HaLaN_16823 [Haematococcus lacustris]|uniref:Uncharacterized protein n=1 Tax=Haematococcus lacustris TaxID=44745 RepID=A0A699ZDC5_HAELA|nr:hypothetical protein HaLaN_16823 [Haematococcus lacustris]
MRMTKASPSLRADVLRACDKQQSQISTHVGSPWRACQAVRGVHGVERARVLGAVLTTAALQAALLDFSNAPVLQRCLAALGRSPRNS